MINLHDSEWLKNYPFYYYPSALRKVYKNISEYELSLLEMDKRIKVYPSMVSPQRVYVPSKNSLYFPVAVPAISHEIAHMVEMTNLKRCVLTDWGMFNGIRIMEQPPSFVFAALSREIRVRAIQMHMNIEQRLSDHSLFIENNTAWLKLVRKSLPFCRFKIFRDVLDWSNDLGEKTYNNWNLERIRIEWIKKLDYIKNWMETS